MLNEMFFCKEQESGKIVAVFDEAEKAEKFSEEYFYNKGAAWDAVAEAGDEEAPESAFLAGFYGSGIEILTFEQWNEPEAIDCYLEKLLRHPLLKAVKGEKVSCDVNDMKLELRELTNGELVCMLALIYILSESHKLTWTPDYRAIRWKIYDCILIYERFNRNRNLLLRKLEERLSIFLFYEEAGTITRLSQIKMKNVF